MERASKKEGECQLLASQGGKQIRRSLLVVAPLWADRCAAQRGDLEALALPSQLQFQQK